MTVDSYLHQGRQVFIRWAADPRLGWMGRAGSYALAGLVFSAAALANRPMPFAMALAGAMTGWRAAVLGLGSVLGYLLFWGAAGVQGVVWTVLSGATALLVGKRPAVRRFSLLIPALSALWVAAAGLGFQISGFDTPTLIYLLRIALAWASAQLFGAYFHRREPLLSWCVEGIGVLALAQLAPVPWLNPGILAAGALAVGEGFPGAILAGLALDLSRVSPVPMTAVLAAVCGSRMIPGIPQWLRRMMPGIMYLMVAAVSGFKGLSPVPALVLGGFLSVFLPKRAQTSRRRGETGLVQVRLEILAEVLSQTRLLLLETEDPPIDEEALLARTRERACGSCPNRRGCRAPAQIPRELLRRPMTENTSLPFFCRKPGRMVLEVRRTQEQYRLLRGERERRREYRGAVSQQYLFLSEYLRSQSDALPRRNRQLRIRFEPEVAWISQSREQENGDKFRHFSAPGGRYFLLLCDGMGTGIGAAEAGRTASQLLQGMLTAGFPAEHALESLNSLLALRGRAGAVAVDLTELRLDTGAAVLYKWGAAPSYLLRGGGLEKIGTAGPPPGIRGQDTGQHQERLSLGRGETLILLSDGVDGEGVHRRGVREAQAPPGELAARLLEAGAPNATDDATVAVVRLQPLGMLT